MNRVGTIATLALFCLAVSFSLAASSPFRPACEAQLADVVGRLIPQDPGLDLDSGSDADDLTPPDTSSRECSLTWTCQTCFRQKVLQEYRKGTGNANMDKCGWGFGDCPGIWRDCGLKMTCGNDDLCLDCQQTGIAYSRWDCF